MPRTCGRGLVRPCRLRGWEFPPLSLCPFLSSRGALETLEEQAGPGTPGTQLGWRKRKTGKTLEKMSGETPFGPGTSENTLFEV